MRVENAGDPDRRCRFTTGLLALVLLPGLVSVAQAGKLTDLSGKVRPQEGITMGALQAVGKSNNQGARATKPKTPEVRTK